MEPKENPQSESFSNDSGVQASTQTQEDLNSSNPKLVPNPKKYKLPSTNELHANINNDLLDEIVENTWHLYRVSQLRNLSFTSEKFNEYSDLINLALVNNLNDKHDNVFEVKILKIPILNNNDKCFALKFQVYMTVKPKKTVLKVQSILLSWGEYKIENNLCHLPFMMCMGDNNIIRHVNAVICDLFETTIVHLEIPQIDIMWLSTIVNDADNNEDVYLKYKMNSSLKNVISVKFPNNIIKKLWSAIITPGTGEVNYQQMELFFQQMQCQSTKTYGINFEFLKLYQISVGNAALYCEGKVKMLTNDAIVKILTFINEISSQ